jgi:DNA invertase Pin-like site-specific DNA recombinase
VAATLDKSGAKLREGRVPAAQYVRMSTENQKYSTQNQADAIADYADRRGFVVVRTYKDAGKSGLSLDGRPSLRQLIADVCSASIDFEAILVYDVSRWGRFQDADESAHYEFICREAGVAVEYCAEQFDNDGSASAAIIKSVKRIMAAEYSRELSIKVFAGQCRMVRLGFRLGGSAGFGLRRQIVDEVKIPRIQLGLGERKGLLTDRVILVPGPAAEIEVVRRMFQMFVTGQRSEFEIARVLNSEGSLTDRGFAWSSKTVHSILTNEKYLGNNIFNRTSGKLRKKRAPNPRELWVRRDGAFAPIIESQIFAAAQRRFLENRVRFTEKALLDRLREMLAREGKLSARLIDKTKGMPCCETYRIHFGSLVRAWRLVGYELGRDFAYVLANKVLRSKRPEMVSRIVEIIEHVGGATQIDTRNSVLTVNGQLRATVAFARCRPTKGFAIPRWYVSLRGGPPRDITIVVRIAPGDARVHDYCVLPWPRTDTSPHELQLGVELGVTESDLGALLVAEAAARHSR